MIYYLPNNITQKINAAIVPKTPPIILVSSSLIKSSFNPPPQLNS